MKPTTTNQKSNNAEAGEVLHLVTPQSQGLPLCGALWPVAAIGAYCEHLDDKGEWCREVFGKNGRAGNACEACLALYPSLLWGRPNLPNDSIDLQAVIRITPYPQTIRDEFTLKGYCISDDFIVESQPVITGQRVLYGKVALAILTRIVPKPIGKR